MNATLHAALDCASRGWHVFPTIPGDKRPAVKDWEHRATRDPDVITWTWGEPSSPYAACGLAVACGPSRLVVIDCDTAKGESPPERLAGAGITDGADVLALLCQQRGQPFPTDTFMARTASGGMHLYFTAPAAEIRNSAGKLGWRIDVRAAGGYVVAPPTVVRAGAYTVLGDAMTPTRILPGWLAALCAPPPADPLPPATAPAVHGAGYGTAALRGILADLTEARPGTRNTELNRAAHRCGQLIAAGSLDGHAAVAALLAAGEYLGLPARETESTITSGLRAGLRGAAA